MSQRRLVTAQILGDWGVTRPGDVETQAPGALEAYCLSCLYDDFAPGDGATAFRGNAAELYNAVSPYYLGLGGHPIQTWNNDTNAVEEDISSVYAQFAWKGEIGGRPSNLVAGVRYEETDVTSDTLQAVPTTIVWTADNDFAQNFGGGAGEVLTGESNYDHFLPSLDFSVEVLDNVVVRASYSKTIGRNDFGFLFAGQNAGTPPRATALGVVATGGTGNPGLVPLESTNLDLSLEVYFGDASYISLGFFDKNVDNFQGTGVFSQNMFGLRDPSSGAPGTRSGQASALIPSIPGAVRNDVNLFVLTAMIDNPTAFPDPSTGVPRQFDKRRSQPVVCGPDLRYVRHPAECVRIRCSTSGSHSPSTRKKPISTASRWPSSTSSVSRDSACRATTRWSTATSRSTTPAIPVSINSHWMD